MSIAVIWPLTKDIVSIYGKTHTHMGSIPYYVGKALYALEQDASLYVTHAQKDDQWVKKNISPIQYTSIYSLQTLSVHLIYDVEDINKRKQKIEYTPHTISYNDLWKEIENYETIVMWPLFYDDIEPLLFRQLSHKKIILGNFGMFNYAVDGMMKKQYPERALSILPYVDYLFLDKSEILFLAQKDTLEAAIIFLQAYVSNIIVTNGSQWSTLYIWSDIFQIPAFAPKQVVDPTGAGDTYLAAFIAKERETDDYNMIGRFAAMAATCKIEKTWPLVASRGEIEKRLLHYTL